MRFCGKCAALLEKTCPNCDFSNPSEFEFCGKCGHGLSIAVDQPRKDLSFDEKIAKIQRYLPECYERPEVNPPPSAERTHQRDIRLAAGNGKRTHPGCAYCEILA